jgi:hypothetical protein
MVDTDDSDENRDNDVGEQFGTATTEDNPDRNNHSNNHSSSRISLTRPMGCTLTETQQEMMRRMLRERRPSQLPSSSSSSVAAKRIRPDAEVAQEGGRDEDNDDGNGERRAETVETLLADDMTSLSMKEREDVVHEIHGLSRIREETPGFVQDRLRAMQAALDALGEADRRAYSVAMQLDPSYVEDPDFRLKFLRCDLWDADAAALRLARHLQVKLDLFGRDLLCRDVRQRDLSPEARRGLMGGAIQILPVRDSVGRVVVLLLPDLTDPDIPAEALLQRSFYINTVTTEDVTSQRNGSVLVVFKKTRREHPVSFRRHFTLLSALPIRRNAVHVCFDLSIVTGSFGMFKYACEKFTRQRVRIHKGKGNPVGGVHGCRMYTSSPFLIQSPFCFL